MKDPSIKSARLPPGSGDIAAREAKVEELLLAGLDAYLGGQYESAIHVWTRVLFLDRGHARARAYIERARSAIAERQRESDELLHHGAEALDRGEIDAALDLVTSSMERGGAHDEASALLARLDRLRPATPTPTPVRGTRVRARLGTATVPAPARRSWSVRWLVALIVLAAGALYAAASWESFESGSLLPRRTPAGAAAASPVTLSIPTRAEFALERAQSLFERGHPHEALAALEGIPPFDPRRGEADRLASAIQRVLLATAMSSSPEGPKPPSGVRVGPQ